MTAIGSSSPIAAFVGAVFVAPVFGLHSEFAGRINNHEYSLCNCDGSFIRDWI
jgi:hypothetical protein